MPIRPCLTNALLDDISALNRRFVAVFVDAALGVPIGDHFAPRVGVGVGVPIERPNFFLQGVGPVHQPGVVVGRLSLAVEGRLPL